MAVTGDGGIPVFHRAYDGKAGEVNQVVAAMEALKKLADQRSFLLVGDSKLVSYTNLAAIAAAGVTFVAPASKAYVGVETLAGCDKDKATAVDYVPERHTTRTRPAEPPAYELYEDTMVIAGPRKADPVLDLRRMFVWSSGNAAAAVTNRNRKCASATEELDAVIGGLGGRYYKTQAQVTAKVAAISAKRRVGGYLRSEIGVDADGNVTFAWHFDQAALDAEAATDGWYALLTNLAAAEADAAEVLRRYKGQEVVERRYRAHTIIQRVRQHSPPRKDVADATPGTGRVVPGPTANRCVLMLSVREIRRYPENSPEFGPRRGAVSFLPGEVFCR